MTKEQLISKLRLYVALGYLGEFAELLDKYRDTLLPEYDDEQLSHLVKDYKLIYADTDTEIYEER